MTNINLNDVNEDHLFGEWKVETRFNIENDTSNIFSKNNRLIFSKTFYKAINGTQESGAWEIIMKTGIIYNPQLVFYKENILIAKAIITRLMIMQEDIKKYKKDYILTLYFTNGLELILNKKYEEVMIE